jgi:hypothetical protein
MEAFLPSCFRQWGLESERRRVHEQKNVATMLAFDDALKMLRRQIARARYALRFASGHLKADFKTALK